MNDHPWPRYVIVHGNDDYEVLAHFGMGPAHTLPHYHSVPVATFVGREDAEAWVSERAWP